MSNSRRVTGISFWLDLHGYDKFRTTCFEELTPRTDVFTTSELLSCGALDLTRLLANVMESRTGCRRSKYEMMGCLAQSGTSASECGLQTTAFH